MKKVITLKMLALLICTASFTTIFAQIASTDFVTTWNTATYYNTTRTSVKIPTFQSGYNYDVDWDNDGIFDTLGVTGNITHDYGVVCTPTIRIRGSFPRIYFQNNEQITAINQWGDNTWSTMHMAFYACANLTIPATDAPDLSAVTNMSFMFAFSKSFSDDIGHWDVSNVTSMFATFYNCHRFNGDIGNWDVSNVTDMSYMFFQSLDFNQDISSWDVSNVTDMNNMFNYCRYFNKNLSSWNTGQVTNMYRMFYRSYVFNQDIGSWNVANVTNFNGMFSSCHFNQDLSNWDVSNATNMGYMFERSTFNYDIGGWDISNVTNMGHMFDNGYFLSTTNYDATLIGWAAQNVQPGVTLGAANIKYCAAESARDHLINDMGWTINDAGYSLTIDAGEDGLVLFNSTNAVDPIPCATIGGHVNYATFYEWIDDQGTVVSNAPIISVCPSVTTTYTLTAFSDDCSISDDVTVVAMDVAGTGLIDYQVGNNEYKVYVCYNGITEEANVNANCNAPTSLCWYLNNGATLGGCSSSARMAFNEEKNDIGIISENDFNVFPNPFSGSTTISFTLSRTEVVNLEVYNVLGKRVATLYNNLAVAGQNYTVKLDRSTLLSSGIYYCRLSAGEEVLNKKIILAD